MYKCLGFQLLIKWQTISSYMANSVSHIEQHLFVILMRYWVYACCELQINHWILFCLMTL